MDYILLQVHNATYSDFSILIPENSKFKLHLKDHYQLKEINLNLIEIFTSIR